MNKRANRCLAGVMVMAAAPTLLYAGDDAPEFHLVGDGLAYGVSGDGSLVVGGDLSGFTWSREDGLILVGGSSLIAASSDGRYAVGDYVDGSGETAARLDPFGNWLTFGGLGPSGCDASLSSAYDISDDGTRCVGLGWDGCSASAFLWTESDGMLELPMLGSSASRADTISGDGLFIGGWDQASNGTRRAATWTFNGRQWVEQLLLAGTPGNSSGYGEVSGCNGDGSIVVGIAEGTGSGASGAFVQRDGGSVDVLGFIPFSQSPVVAGLLDTSEDGSTLVGFQREGIGGFAVFTATIWTEKTGLVDLKQYLEGLGASIPSGFQLAAAMGISDDGSVICGWGYSGFIFNQEAWVVTLPAQDVPCPADFDGDGLVDGADLGQLLAKWGACTCIEDLNFDGLVNGEDLGILLAAWGACP